MKIKIPDFSIQKFRKFMKLEYAIISAFCLTLIAGFVISFLIPLRPAVSLIEKRKLTVFPAFSV